MSKPVHGKESIDVEAVTLAKEAARAVHKFTMFMKKNTKNLSYKTMHQIRPTLEVMNLANPKMHNNFNKHCGILEKKSGKSTGKFIALQV